MSTNFTPETRRRLAGMLGITEQFLYQCLTGRREMDPADAMRAEEVTSKELRRWHLVSKRWHRIWPDLKKAKGAPEVLERESAIARLVAHHGGLTKFSSKLDKRPAYQEVQRWLRRGWASPAHIFRLEPLLPEGMSVRDLYLDREAAQPARATKKKTAPRTRGASHG